MNSFNKKNSLAISLHGDIQNIKYYSIKEVEQLLDFKYLSYLVYSNWKIEQYVSKVYSKAKKQYRILPNSLWLGKLHEKDIENMTIPKIAICWVNSQIGYGIFATQNIPAWSFIGEYTGVLRKRRSIWLDENDYCFRYPTPKWTWRYLTIDSGQQGNFTRFINHSDLPNAEAISIFYNNSIRIIIRSIKLIEKHQQITYDYGPLYWKHRKKQEEFIPIEN